MSFELVGIQEQLQSLLMNQQAITKMEPWQVLEMQQKIQALHEVQQDVITSQHQSHDIIEPKFIQEMVDSLGTTDEYAKVIVNGVEYMPSKRSHVELPESQYHAYIHTLAGLFRFNIPLAENHDVKLKTIFHNPANPLPYHVGLFSHHHKLYMVGGHVGCDYNSNIYTFNPIKFRNLPISDPSLLDNPEEFSESWRVRILDPLVTRCGDQIYFLCPNNSVHGHYKPYSFQSLNLTKNLFKSKEYPPNQVRRGSVTGFFSLCGYVYLFFTGSTGCTLGCIFDTRSSEWRTNNLDQFDKSNIPIPSFHIGDVGLSKKFSDDTRILITLGVENPVAYCVQLREDGSLSPNSCRCLDDIFIPTEYKDEQKYSRLFDIGQDRFCVVYQSSCMPLLIRVFEMNFDAEHDRQCFGNNSKASSRLLSSKIIEDSIPLLGGSITSALCLVPVTRKKGRDKASTSNRGRDNSGPCLAPVTRKKGKDEAATSNRGEDAEKEREKQSHSTRGVGGRSCRKR